MSILYDRLIAPTPSNLDQLQRIYETNFQPATRKPFEYIATGINSGAYICVVARQNDNVSSIVGLAFLLPLPATDSIFLEYIAIDDRRQGQGIGSELFRFLVRYFNDEKIASGVLWEVDPPVSCDPNDENNRRIRFYERLGGKLIDLSTTYRMPDYETGASDGVFLRLMQAPLTRQPDKSKVIAMVKAIYAIAYPGEVALRDKIIEELAG